ncbi:hypothetical protein O6H91_13G076100 [Diphasiastrum complanatum]|uniref:Uncharacterized protein n=1 Tax=Diphasiastrum complanatum TaxID=34168 RepID=A0ACC2BW63_DIPCM|nr:hypothetical protein O6H91_13G076100 [Diphasiastrum complanatum]
MTWGQVTATIYGFIRDAKYTQAIRLLEEQLHLLPDSQAALSLLGYCHYFAGDYVAAASMYSKLVGMHATEEKYRLYHAQSLYKAGMLVDAHKACMTIEGKHNDIKNLQACIRYDEGDFAGSRFLLEQIADESFDAMINLGCCLYKDGDYQGAYAKFSDAMNALGFQPDLAYNKALCLYSLRHSDSALKNLEDIFEYGVREHPELGVGSHMEGMEPFTVGNSQTLKDSALVEAFNLKNPPFPPELSGNLLLLYCKPSHAFLDLAADLIAEHSNTIFKSISQDLYDFVNAMILTQTSQEDAYLKFNELASHHTEVLRHLTKQMEDTRVSCYQDTQKRALADYSDALEKYIPVVMAMAKIFWDKENYTQVGRIFHQSADLCSEHPIWRLNVAHTFFMQGNKYQEAIHYYQPLVTKSGGDTLSVPAIVLANLCVSYIMTSQNEEAEDLMRKIEKDEERAQYENPERQNLHLCIVNLVIGTLYCAKQNFEFGVSRIIRSLEPCSKKLETDTWFYAKRCFLALLDNLAKQMIVLKDTTYADLDNFLEEADKCGKTILIQHSSTDLQGTTSLSQAHAGTVSLSYEARIIKRMFLKLRE